MVEGGGPVAALGIELDEPALGGFVQGVERRPPPGIGERRLEAPVFAQVGRESVEGGAEGGAPFLRLKTLPVLEIGGVDEAEPGHEVAAIEIDRLGDGSLTSGLQGLSQGVDIHPHRGRRSQRHLSAVGGDEARPQQVIDLPDGAAQVGQRRGWIVVRPEEVGQGVAFMAAAFDGQVGEERHGLAPVCIQGAAIDFEARRAEEKEGKAAGGGHRLRRHGCASLGWGVVVL